MLTHIARAVDLAPRLLRQLGPLDTVVAAVPGVERLVWSRLQRPIPGRLYSFLATKPAQEEHHHLGGRETVAIDELAQQTHGSQRWTRSTSS